MSGNVPGEHPDRQQRKDLPTSGEPDPLHDTGRFAPRSPVMPQFAEESQPKAPRKKEDRKKADRSPERPPGQGCNPILVLTVSMLLPLVILAMFLPPISLWSTIQKQIHKQEKSSNQAAPQITVGGVAFIPLNPDSPSVDVDGLTIAAVPRDLTSTFGVHVASLSPADYLDGKFPSEGWYCNSALPANHALASPVYSLSQTGTPPAQLTLKIAAQADAVADPAAIEMHLWNATTGAWEFYAAGADASGLLTVQINYLPRCVVLLREAASARRVGVTLDVTDRFSPDIAAANVRVYPGSLHPTITGALQVVLAPGFETGQGYEVVPLITNFSDAGVIDVGTVQRILENAGLRAEHARQIAAFVLSDSGYAGAAIDYREVPSNLHAEYAAFVRELADLLHSQGRTLTLVLPFPAYNAETKTWNTGAYDWSTIGRIADEIVITMPLDPRAYVPGSTVDSLLGWATTQISRNRLVMGLNALSVEEHSDNAELPVTLSQALSYLNQIQITDASAAPVDTLAAGQSGAAQLANSSGVVAQAGYDDTVKTAYIRYLDQQGTMLRTMWLTDPTALAARIDLAASHKLGGIFVRDIMAPGTIPDLNTVLLSYRLSQPAPLTGAEPTVEWIVSEDGKETGRESKAISEPFTFQTWGGAATVTIEARIDGQTVASRTLSISAPEVTPATAAPLPTEIPVPTQPAETPIATEMPTSVPSPLPASPTPGEGALDLSQPLPTVDPSILASVSLGTQFEAGVQLAQLGPALIEVNKAHLTWVKLDVTYRIGATPGAQQRNIEDLQASGFKVLINVTGDPAEFASIARPDYIAQYATYVGGLALSGIDGIEIWRDMNTQMTAAEYTQILAYSYVAIKTAHPGTMVITGALQPTITADNPDQSDNVYYDNLAAAGAGQYADCIGEQYLIGTVSPSSTSGDPRGDNPVYYLPSATDRALHAFSGVRPVCYTRFGYLSPEGYPALPADYAWAQNTTTAQQAQWLTAAVQLSQEGTQVRLLIIYALEAAAFPTGSPEAGYAIVRPDGSCPACDALGTLLKPGS